jgi:predicted transcriptional regulator
MAFSLHPLPPSVSLKWTIREMKGKEIQSYYIMEKIVELLFRLVGERKSCSHMAKILRCEVRENIKNKCLN